MGKDVGNLDRMMMNVATRFSGRVCQMSAYFSTIGYAIACRYVSRGLTEEVW